MVEAYARNKFVRLVANEILRAGVLKVRENSHVCLVSYFY